MEDKLKIIDLDLTIDMVDAFFEAPVTFISLDRESLRLSNYHIFEGIGGKNAYLILDYFNINYPDVDSYHAGNVYDRSHLVDVNNEKIEEINAKTRSFLEDIIESEIQEINELKGKFAKKFMLLGDTVDLENDFIYRFGVSYLVEDLGYSWEDAEKQGYEDFLEIAIDNKENTKSEPLLGLLNEVFNSLSLEQKNSFQKEVLTPKAMGALYILAFDKLFFSLHNEKGKSCILHWYFLDDFLCQVDPTKNSISKKESKTANKIISGLERGRAKSVEVRKQKFIKDEKIRIDFAKDLLSKNINLSAPDLASQFKKTDKGQNFTKSTLVNYFQTAKTKALQEMITSK